MKKLLALIGMYDGDAMTDIYRFIRAKMTKLCSVSQRQYEFVDVFADVLPK